MGCAGSAAFVSTCAERVANCQRWNPLSFSMARLNEAVVTGTSEHYLSLVGQAADDLEDFFLFGLDI